jgi:hypothetical protein
VTKIWAGAGDPGDKGADEYLFPDQWDQVELGGELLPGIAEIVGGGTSQKLDVRSPKGSFSVTIVDNGTEPNRFSIRVTIWTQEQLDVWERMRVKLQPRPGKGGMQRVPIRHPECAAAGVTVVCVEGISFGKPGQARGSREYEIRCIQWTPEVKGNATKRMGKGPSIPDILQTGQSRPPDGGYSPAAANFSSNTGVEVYVPPSEAEAGPE